LVKEKKPMAAEQPPSRPSRIWWPGILCLSSHATGDNCSNWRWRIWNYKKQHGYCIPAKPSHFVIRTLFLPQKPMVVIYSHQAIGFSKSVTWDHHPSRGKTLFKKLKRKLTLQLSSNNI
jgi:hypothetical protein